VSSDDFDRLPAVLTSKEAANALRMGLKELRGLVERGELPAARLGPRRVIRIRKSAVVALLDATVESCKSVRRWKGRPVQ
jgi:excisionase family DNA binding protein